MKSLAVFSLLLLLSLGFVQLAVALFILFCFGLVKTLEFGTRKAVECCKQNLTVCPHRSLKDSNDERNADYRPGSKDCRGRQGLSL